MVKPQQVGKKVRMSFSKINEPLEMPSLIEVQKKSFNWFLEKGLMEVLEDVSPITDYTTPPVCCQHKKGPPVTGRPVSRLL